MYIRRHAAAAGILAVVVAATLVGAPAAPATGQIWLAGDSTVIPGSYIVVLNDSSPGGRADGQRVGAAVPDRAARLARQYGGAVNRVFSAALNGFEIHLSEPSAHRLAADPMVARVEQNQRMSVAGGVQLNPPSWGLDRIDQRALPLDQRYAFPNTALSVHAYLIDTGIRRTHIDFSGRASSGFNAVGTGPADDCNGHGTAIAGIVGGTGYGVAKEVQLVAVRVLDCAGAGTTAGVLAGVDWVTANAIHPAVANMSLGGSASAALDAAVTTSINSGVTYAVAAGNSSSNACNFSPARVPRALTVAGTTITDTTMSSGNFGPCVDLYAPGASITSTWYTGNTATATLSGSSLATPHVAGAAALVLFDHPTWTPAQVSSYLVTNATPLPFGRLLYVVH
jgi:subtilisin family serine protease